MSDSHAAQRVRLAAVWELAAHSLVLDTVPVIDEVRFLGQAHIAANRMFYAVFFFVLRSIFKL